MKKELPVNQNIQLKNACAGSRGITSLSVTPLRIIAMTGFITCIISTIAAIYALIQKTTGTTVEGWTSVMIAIFFLGGVQMLSLGIIGEYVGKIYIETKNRPKYFIDESVGNDSNGK